MGSRYHSILGVHSNASIDEIKRAYKDIALTCHPDKLTHVLDEDAKVQRIERFKEASMAYNALINKPEEEAIDWDDVSSWKEVWNNLFSNSTETKEIIRDTFVDIASTFIKNKIYPKSYYNVSSNAVAPMRHEVSVDVTYREVFLNLKKKLRLVLLDIDEPIFVDISCTNFPQAVIEHTDTDDNEHEVVINMSIKHQDNFDHVIYKSGRIDIITTVDVSLLDYVLGYKRQIRHIDDGFIDIDIPPFQEDIHEVQGKGIKGGSLIINTSVKKFNSKEWNRLCNEDKATMVRILNTMCS